MSASDSDKDSDRGSSADDREGDSDDEREHSHSDDDEAGQEEDSVHAQSDDENEDEDEEGARNDAEDADDGEPADEHAHAHAHTQRRTRALPSPSPSTSSSVPGIVYVSRLPPNMRPHHLRLYLRDMGPLLRVYCAPECAPLFARHRLFSDSLPRSGGEDGCAREEARLLCRCCRRVRPCDRCLSLERGAAAQRAADGRQEQARRLLLRSVECALSQGVHVGPPH